MTMRLTPARRLKHVVEADNVGLEDALPTVLARNAAEMQDAVAAGHHALDRRHVGEVGTVDLLALARRREPHPDAEPQQRIDPAQALAQGAADAAGRAGDQDPMHAECFPIASALRNPNSSERPRRHTRTPARAADGCGRNRDRGKATGPPRAERPRFAARRRLSYASGTPAACAASPG